MTKWFWKNILIYLQLIFKKSLCIAFWLWQCLTDFGLSIWIFKHSMAFSFGCNKEFRKVTNTRGKTWLHFSGYLLEEGRVTWGQIYVGDSNYQWKWEPFEGTRRSRFFKQQAIHSCLNESLPESLIHLNWEARMALSSFENCFNRIKCFW